jgi:hypothetical protein
MYIATYHASQNLRDAQRACPKWIATPEHAKLTERLSLSLISKHLASSFANL